jgi:hypothetical protein
MTYDSDTRLLFAREHADLLRASAAYRPRAGRTRRWLSGRVIGLGRRLAPEVNAHGHVPRTAV